MADLNRSIEDYLSVDSALVAEGVVVRPDALHINDDPFLNPILLFWQVSGTRTDTLQGTVSGVAEARITIDAYSSTRKVANQIAELARLAMIDFPGTRTGLKIRNCSVDGVATHSFDAPTGEHDGLRYVTSQDYRIAYIEDV